MSLRSVPRRPCFLLAALVLAACAGPARSGPQAGRSHDEISVVVENRGFADLVVFARPSTVRYRLGLAPGLQSTRLTLPRGSAGALRLQADPIGGSPPLQTDHFTVAAGDRVRWIIQPNPGMSTWFVRPRSLP